MIAFILSSALAFTLYQLLAFAKWPPTQTRFHFFGHTTLVFTTRTAVIAMNLVRVAIVAVLLLLILAVHNFSSPADILTRYEVNVVFGFVLGPLAAIWVNGVVLHSTTEALSAAQIVSLIGLALLFVLGATGSETSKLISNYAHHLSSLKVAGAELSFTSSKETSGREHVAQTLFADSSSNSQTPLAGESSSNSQALSNLAILDLIIQRDSDYLTNLFTPKGASIPTEDLARARDFANKSLGPPLSCLSAWFEQSGDSGPVNKYLTGYATSFRQLEALNGQINVPINANTDSPDRKAQETQRLKEIAADFVRNGLTMALDIALSAPPQVIEACKVWFDVYCPPDEPTPSGTSGQIPRPAQCLRDSLNQVAAMPAIPSTGKVGKRITELSNGLAWFIEQSASADGESRGLETLPYFAIGRASVMSQLNQHEAAAAILQQWLLDRKNDRPTQAQKIKNDWLVLRVRSMLVAYVEEWLGEAPAPTMVQTEHLKNVRAVRDGFRNRLLKADFFKKLDDACRTRCEPVFKEPTDCDSEELDNRRRLFRALYTSYVTMEYTYIHRALQHPDYRGEFAERINDEARRLVNLDLSCGSREPDRTVVYAQSLLGFAENAVSYAMARTGKDDEDTQKKRLNEADQAVRFGIEILKEKTHDAEENAPKSYLQRIKPTFAVQTNELLRRQSITIQQARKDLDLE